LAFTHCQSNSYVNFGLSVLSVYAEKVKCLFETAEAARTGDKQRKVLDKLKEVKIEVLEELVKHASAFQSTLDNIKAGLSVVNEHYALLVEGLKQLGYSVVEVEAALEDKGLVGVGGGSFHAIYEVGLTWDYIYDLPYISASSVKGATRNWALRKCSELERDDLKRSCVEKVLDLFGAPEGEIYHRDEREWFIQNFGDLKSAISFAGNVFVADAYPIDSGRGVIAHGLLVPDVMTPHYYRGGEVVVDEFEAEPVPIQYLAIAPGTRFKFVIGVKDFGVIPNYVVELSSMLFGKQASSLTALVAGILANALLEGVGAKTGKGYSYFTIEKAVVHRAGFGRRFMRGEYRRQAGESL